MTITRNLTAGLLAACLLVSAAGAQDNRYRPWEQPDDRAADLGQALDELDRLVGEAEEARAADPRFLQDLRGLSQRYRARLQAGPAPAAPATGPYLVEDFADGDYAGNPAWQVVSGNFQVLADRRLISAVVLKDDDREQATRDAGGNSRAGDVIGILSQVLLGSQQPAQGQEQPTVQATAENAEIRTYAEIGNAFVLDVDVSSRTTQGALEFAIFQGQTVRPGYGLLYRTSEGLLLIRRGSTRNETIARADLRGTLFDGIEHNIRWERDGQGWMVVEIDGTQVLRVQDTALRDPFSGLSFVNRGGVHLVHGLRVERR